MTHYYLHRKSGGIYWVRQEGYIHFDHATGDEIMPGYGYVQDFDRPYVVTDPFEAGSRVVFYENALTGHRWARAASMFYDGRFTAFEGEPDLASLR